jgi:hypothetical protein
MRAHGLRSRRGQHRADVKRLPIEVLFFTGAGLAFLTVLALRRRAQGER